MPILLKLLARNLLMGIVVGWMTLGALIADQYRGAW